MSTPPSFPPPAPSPPPRRSSPWLGLFIAGALALMMLFAGVAVIAIVFMNGVFARHPPPVGDTPSVAQQPAPAPPEPAPPGPMPTDPATPPAHPTPVAPEPTPAVEHEPLRRASPPAGRERREPSEATPPRATGDRTRTPPERSAEPRDANPVRAGGAIPQPRKIHDVRPEYPMIAQRARVQGVVIIEARIDRSGKVEDLRVLRSIPLLDQAALDAVRQWEYEPTILNGVPVPVIVTVTVNFTLQ